MAELFTKGLFAALELAAFRERADGSFEAIDPLPGWYVELHPERTAATADRLADRFPFLEHFLTDARSFWAKKQPGQLRSGPWSEGPSHEEIHLEAIAIYHRESHVLLIQLLGEEFEATRAVLQKVRDATLAHQRMLRVGDALAASESTSRVLLDSFPDTLFRLREDGTYLDFTSESGTTAQGRARQIGDLTPEPVARKFLEHVGRVLRSGEPQSFEYTSAQDGGARELEARIARCGTDEVLVLVRDITERKAAESEIATTLQRLRDHRDVLLLILSELRVGAIFTDENGVCTLVSNPAKSLFGLPEKKFLGQSLRELPLFTPDQRVQLESMLGAPRSLRQRIAIRWKGDQDREFWMEADLHDDPRDHRKKILFLYDVSEVQQLRRQLDAGSRFDDIVGKCEPMQQVYRLIDDLAPVDATVLIEGETGTGKELVAAALHKRSRRSGGPFVAVNCAGLTESLVASQLFGHRRGSFTGAVKDQAGVFEAANRGVVFLDEIGDIPPTVQTSLLRVLQEKEITRVGDTRPRKVDVRVIAATHRNLEQEVAEGRFRADLLYRIRVARIHLPPLRDRLQDIALLATRFLADFRASIGKPIEGISTAAMRKLTDYHWPGNVRELRSALEFAAIRSRSGVLDVEDLPPEIVRSPQPPQPSAEPLDDRTRYMQALERAKGNRTKAARLLGVSRATFYRRLAELDLPPS